MRIARLSLLLTAAACMGALHAQDDIVMKAMRDEMGRSMKQLTIENLEKPYFIAYRVVDSENAGAGASFGALNRSNSSRSRRLHVEVRVGDYKLDNSHFFFFNMNQGTTTQIYNGTMMLTLEDDYKESRRHLTSEGPSYARREPSVAFNASAATQAADGTMLDDFLWFHGRSVAELPSQDELASRIHELGKNLTDLRDAPPLASYSAPVLADGDAAPQMFRLMFLHDLIGAKQTINGMQGMNINNTNQAENPFLDRVGARVLPEFLTVVDNPLIAEYQGRHVAAQSKMDEDGMLSREVRLIDRGILKTLLMSRDPVRGFDHTTGSRHAGQAAPSNVIVTSSAGLSAADLRAKFIDLIKQRNRPFGVVVRRLRTANSVVLAYKVFPEGHEELVRGLQFVGMNPAAFKDIVAASKEPNFLTVQYR